MAGASLGYGLPVFGGGFTGTPNVGFGLSVGARDYRLGWRLTPADRADGGGVGDERQRSTPLRAGQAVVAGGFDPTDPARRRALAREVLDPLDDLTEDQHPEDRGHHRESGGEDRNAAGQARVELLQLRRQRPGKTHDGEGEGGAAEEGGQEPQVGQAHGRRVAPAQRAGKEPGARDRQHHAGDARSERVADGPPPPHLLGDPRSAVERRPDEDDEQPEDEDAEAEDRILRDSDSHGGDPVMHRPACGRGGPLSKTSLAGWKRTGPRTGGPGTSNRAGATRKPPASTRPMRPRRRRAAPSAPLPGW